MRSKVGYLKSKFALKYKLNHFNVTIIHHNSLNSQCKLLEILCGSYDYYVANLAIIDLAQSILYNLIESSTLLESSIVN